MKRPGLSPRPKGHDEPAYRSALARARQGLTQAEATLATAMAEANRLNALLVGPNPLTAAEAVDLAAYVNG